MHFLNSDAIKETGYSTVIIKHKGNEYMGQAKCHPKDIFSQFTGCRYAEIRAEIKALKAELKEKKAACEECRKFVIAVTQYANFDGSSPTAKAMYRQLNRRIKEVNNLIDEINDKEFMLQMAIKMQDSLTKKLTEKD